MRVVSVRTEGMSCSKCSALVEKAIGRLDGVLSVTSSDSEGMTTVLYDETRVERRTLATAIESAGFGATILD